MGGSIAQVITYSGLPVVIKDIEQKFVDKALEKVRSIYQSRVDKGKMSAGEIESKIALAMGFGVMSLMIYLLVVIFGFVMDKLFGIGSFGFMNECIKLIMLIVFIVFSIFVIFAKEIYKDDFIWE